MEDSKIIKIMAEKLAQLQKKADKFYYEDNNQNMSSFLLDQCIPIKDICIKLGINKEVWQEADKIYDFRHSGKKGFEQVYKLNKSIEKIRRNKAL